MKGEGCLSQIQSPGISIEGEDEDEDPRETNATKTRKSRVAVKA